MEELQESPAVSASKNKSTIKRWLKSDSAVQAADLVAGAIAIVLIFWWLQYSTDAICCGDYDGYYHIKWARLLYRMNMTKAPPFAIIFLVLGTYLMFERKYWPLLPLAFVFALTYDMFVLLVLAVVIWTIVIAWTEARFEWRPLAWVALGSLLGLVINPYFPRNLYLFYEHARVKITATDFATKVGQEWYPYDTREFVINCYVALAAMLIGYLAFDGSDRKRAQRPLYFLILSTLLMLMTARWKRFAEYFPPFAILFVAFTLENFWRGRAVFTHLPDDVMEDLQPFLDRQQTAATAKENKNDETWKWIKVGLVGCVLGGGVFANVYQTAHD